MGVSTGSTRGPTVRCRSPPQTAWRHADIRSDPTRRRFVAVREDHTGEGMPTNTIVAIPLDGGESTVLVSGPDFVASPRLSPDGSQMAWLEWDHPDMPWDATRLRVAAFEPDGTLGPSTLAAGGPEESIVQPEWAPDGTLHLISDRSGWWNLYRLVEGPRLEPLAPMDAEFAEPSWVFDRSSYGFLPDGAIVAIATLRRARPAVPARARAPHRRGRDPVHRARIAPDRSPRRSLPWPAGRAIPRSSCGSTRRRWRRPVSCAERAR